MVEKPPNTATAVGKGKGKGFFYSATDSGDSATSRTVQS